eukprot:g4356.t1
MVKVSVKTLVLGGTAYCGGVGAFMVYYKKELGRVKQGGAETVAGGACACGCVSESERMQAFDNNATSYDDDIGTDETFMGLGLLRQWMIRKATGRTLEVAAGTGRNIQFYSTGTELTLTDCSQPMVAVMQNKLDKEGRTPTAAVVRADAARMPQFADGSFDTVVDTFGLCSFENEQAVLAEMRRVCKPDGKILLLEHGRSHYDWLNRILDRGADQHAQRWGCYWQKDIAGIVARSGMGVVDSSRWHFGTTYIYTLSPRPATGQCDLE